MFEDGRIIPRRLSMQKVQEYRIIKSKLRNANSQMPLITAKLIFYYKLKFFRSYINLAFPFFHARTDGSRGHVRKQAIFHRWKEGDDRKGKRSVFVFSFLFPSFRFFLFRIKILITPLSVLLINVVINVRKELLCVNVKEFRLTNRNSKYRVWVRPSCKWLKKADNT